MRGMCPSAPLPGAPPKYMIPPPPALKVEVAWFSALCGDDYEFLGVHDGRLRSSYEHCGEIVRRADARGYQNVLLPSGWIAGQDALTFAAAIPAIISGGIAERAKFWPQLIATAVIVGLVYPLYEGVAWNKALGVQARIEARRALGTLRRCPASM